jgi:uncharacterized protein Yka (UPF0111/DUF47 family)
VRLIPRDEQFFGLFEQLSKRLSGSAELLRQLFDDPSRLNELVGRIKDQEHEADSIVQQVNQRIDTSFVTPLDREDIHRLATRLDNVIDLIDGTARRAAMFHIKDTRPHARQLSEILVRAVALIAKSVSEVKKPKNVYEYGKQIKLIEEEGDAAYQEAVGLLFAGSPDALEVIKWKELFDKLEEALDECEDVSNVLESIALKNS